ncbi:MAG TPA: hypothetical protein VNM87_08220, partial [Candidatus Udaeobacter sp.]|nr:hypothetical protein [Candidatus Udaeobacter sp.]
AIGYDGLGYITPHEKVIAVARRAGEPFVGPSVESAKQHRYPLARPLLIYSAGQPTGQIAAYLDWITSAPGQAIVERLGFVPIGKPNAG